MNNINEVLFDSKKVIKTNLLNVEQNVYIYNNVYSFEEPLNQNEFLYLTYKKSFDQESGFQQTEFNIEQYIKKEEHDLSLTINNNINNANNVSYKTPLAKSTFNFSIKIDHSYDYFKVIEEIFPCLEKNFLNKVYKNTCYSKYYWGNFSNNISNNYFLLNLNEKKVFKTLPFSQVYVNPHDYYFYGYSSEECYYGGFHNYLNSFSYFTD